MRAVGYYRVSKDVQATDAHVSLDVQQRRVESYCAAHGYELVSAYTDVQSGRRDDRPQYQEMLTTCRAGGIQHVVVMFFDRFGRTMRESMTRVWELEQLGIEVEATEEPIPKGDDSLMQWLKLWLAERESRRIGERSRAALAHRIEQGLVIGKRPYGWRKAKLILTLHEDEAAIVREMARLVVDENVSLRGVALHLNAGGAKTHHGKLWSADAVLRVLNRPANAGTIEYKRGGSVEVPAIYSKETAKRVRERLDLRRRMTGGPTHKAPHLLVGLLHCGDCGSTMVGRSRPQYARPTLYYSCLGQMKHGICTVNYVNAAYLEDAVLRALRDRLDEGLAATLTPDSEPPPRNWSSERAAIEATLQATERELKAAYDLYRNGTLDQAQLAAVTRTERERRQAAEQRRDALAREQADADRRQQRIVEAPAAILSFLDVFEAATTLQRKGAFRDIVERVTYWHGAGRVEVTMR